MNVEIEHGILNSVLQYIGEFIPPTLLSYTAPFELMMHRDIDFQHLYEEMWSKENSRNNYRRMHGLPLIRKQQRIQMHHEYIEKIMDLYDCSFDRAKIIHMIGPIGFI